MNNSNIYAFFKIAEMSGSKNGSSQNSTLSESTLDQARVKLNASLAKDWILDVPNIKVF